MPTIGPGSVPSPAVPAARAGFSDPVRRPLGAVAGMLLSLVVLPLLGADAPPDSDWNQWKGPKRDGLSPDTGLLKEWPAGGPPLLWKTTGLGDGYSSIIIHSGHLFTMGDVGGAACLISLGATDGKILWTSKFGEAGGTRDPGTRATPATDGKLLFGIGQAGEVVCAQADTGKIQWQKHLEKDFGGKRPQWCW
ncbi:MAG TPA: PQQ-binding-like beta-propeller repeat protein, partial [Planctomycetota bacterium]|nr:PQQ-binding-like beta-propeller repeat protein [Planctomycetota bacterium]